MKKMSACPVALVTVHDKQPRIVAGFVALLILLFLGTGAWEILLLLLVDFFLRAFKWERYSPLGRAAGWLIRYGHLPGKRVDIAPKRFAAVLGFSLTLFILLADVFWGFSVARYISIVLLFFALLESVLGFCVGCRIFQVLLRIGWVS